MSGTEMNAPLQSGEIEVRGPSADKAIEAGLAELGLEDQAQAEITILRKEERGFLGFGGKDAVVRMRVRPARKRRRRRRGKSSESGGEGERAKDSRRKEQSQDRASQGDRKPKSSKPKSSKPAPSSERSREQHKRKPSTPRSERGASEQKRDSKPGEAKVEIQEQATIVEEFLTGLLDSFGLEGAVETRVEEDIIYADVTGEQTEALVGQKGAHLQAVLELCRTVVQRKSQAGARLRLDIAGYAERRRAALKIYVARLAKQVLDGGGEIMLEPMNPADRKAVHDAASEIDGVRSFSEGEDPDRSVVIAPSDD